MGRIGRAPPIGCDDIYAIAWKDRAVIATLSAMRGGILDVMRPDAEVERLAERVEEARCDDLQNIAENMILFDD